MTHPESSGARAREHFEAQWREGDFWKLEAELDRASHARQLELVSDRRYPRALEVGCGAGACTRLLAEVADHLLAIDIAPSAVARARAAGVEQEGVELRAANVMDLDVEREGPWDLVVMSETIYCLGWLYPLFDVAWLAERLHEALRPEGRLLMANTYGRPRDYLMRPYLIDTYRDLFVNVGFRLAHPEVMRATKGGVDYEIAISLFERAATGARRALAP